MDGEYSKSLEKELFGRHLWWMNGGNDVLHPGKCVLSLTIVVNGEIEGSWFDKKIDIKTINAIKMWDSPFG